MTEKCKNLSVEKPLISWESSTLRLIHLKTSYADICDTFASIHKNPTKSTLYTQSYSSGPKEQPIFWLQNDRFLNELALNDCRIENRDIACVGNIVPNVHPYLWIQF